MTKPKDTNRKKLVAFVLPIIRKEKLSMSEELEKLRHKQYVAERKLTAAKHKEKRLQSELKRLTRSERTHRLCTRAGMLETFLKEPTVLTDEDVMELMISTKVPCSNHPEEATLPLRWFCQLSLCGLAAEERLQAIIPRQQVNIPPLDRTEKYRSFFSTIERRLQPKCPYPIWKSASFSGARAALLLPDLLTE